MFRRLRQILNMSRLKYPKSNNQFAIYEWDGRFPIGVRWHC